MPPLGRRHSSSSQTVCASSVRLSVEQSRVICRIRSNSSGFNSRPQNDRPPPMVTGMMWSLLVAGPHAYLTEISRKCPEKSLPIPRYRSGLHSVLQLANLQAQASACDDPPQSPAAPANIDIAAFGAGVLDEQRSKQLFAAFGIAVPREIAVTDGAQAEQAARKLGGKVVLKALS